MTSKTDDAKASGSDTIPFTEWMVSLVGGAIVLATLFFLLHKALFADTKPPDLDVTVLSILPRRAGVVVRAQVVNHGGETVAGLLVTAESVGFESEVTIDFLPGKSSREVGFNLPEAPDQEEIKFRFGGYQEP